MGIMCYQLGSTNDVGLCDKFVRFSASLCEVRITDFTNKLYKYNVKAICNQFFDTQNVIKRQINE